MVVYPNIPDNNNNTTEGSTGSPKGKQNTACGATVAHLSSSHIDCSSSNHVDFSWIPLLCPRPRLANTYTTVLSCLLALLASSSGPLSSHSSQTHNPFSLQLLSLLSSAFVVGLFFSWDFFVVRSVWLVWGFVCFYFGLFVFVCFLLFFFSFLVMIQIFMYRGQACFPLGKAEPSWVLKRGSFLQSRLHWHLQHVLPTTLSFSVVAQARLSEG